jgi:uncharacterized membrane protein
MDRPIEPALPRQRSITGVARALIATVGVDDAVAIMLSQFGWDVTFLALAHMSEGQRDAEVAGRALYIVLEALAGDAG